MKTENQKTKEEILEAEIGSFKFYPKSLISDILSCMEEYATLPAQESSDAVELLEWIHKNDYRPCIINGTQKAFTSNITRLDVSIEQLLSIFLKEKGAHNG